MDSLSSTLKFSNLVSSPFILVLLIWVFPSYLSKRASHISLAVEELLNIMATFSLTEFSIALIALSFVACSSLDSVVKVTPSVANVGLNPFSTELQTSINLR